MHDELWQALIQISAAANALLLGAVLVLSPRLLLPDVGWLFDIVPLAGAAVFLTFTVLVLTDSRALRALSRIDAVKQPAEDILATVEAYMREEKPHLDPGLTLDQLASAIAVAPRALSQAIGASSDGNFYGFMSRHRIAEARALLLSPRESRTSIEAIALMAGFRSRSTFYEAFQREVGMTPAEFRRRHAESGPVSG